MILENKYWTHQLNQLGQLCDSKIYIYNLNVRSDNLAIWLINRIDITSQKIRVSVCFHPKDSYKVKNLYIYIK